MSLRPVRLAGCGFVVAARTTRCTGHLAVVAMASSSTSVYGGISTQSDTRVAMRFGFSYMPFSFCRYLFFVLLLFYFQDQSPPFRASGFSVIAQKAGTPSSPIFRTAASHSRLVPDASRGLFVPLSAVVRTASPDGFPRCGGRSWSGVHSDRAVYTRAWGCQHTSPPRENVVSASHSLRCATLMRSASRPGHRSRAAVPTPLPVRSFCSHTALTSQQHVSSDLWGSRDSYALPASAGERGLAKLSQLTECVGTRAGTCSPVNVVSAFTTPPCFLEGVRGRGPSRSRMERVAQLFLGVITSGGASRLSRDSREEANDRQVTKCRLGEASEAGGKNHATVMSCDRELRKTEQVPGLVPLSSLKAPLKAVRVGHGYDLHHITLNPREATGPRFLRVAAPKGFCVLFAGLFKGA
ncbi:hypothetical protein CSUI_000569 [Cystoisospora suis]|uniref:Transmembrane protein n=1 Tax=Cystoisospora suis TaxID=483139 RepID=A0A2C6LBS4_9APIC|nr:hypothetical protein CSUI_000569 [Cystoisospora suis]